MRRNFLTELASNPDLISGIYNYCDRWCERCPLTARCLVYVTEQEDPDNDTPGESNDSQNQAFWSKLGDGLNDARQMITEWARKQGIDLAIHSGAKMDQAKSRSAETHPLARAGKTYANGAADWFRTFDRLVEFSDHEPTDLEIENAQQVEDAREVISWYQYQIAVKIIRALSSLPEDDELAAESIPRDCDGSAKVALIGIERSLVSWHLMQLHFHERRESMAQLMLQLEQLRLGVERKFPHAREFIRPGFDEQLVVV